jgi:hypothetical protein
MYVIRGLAESAARDLLTVEHMVQLSSRPRRPASRCASACSTKRKGKTAPVLKIYRE